MNSLELPDCSTSPGPWAGIPAWRGTATTTVKLPQPVSSYGTLMLWIKLDTPVVNGPGVASDGDTVLELPGLAALKVWWYSGYAGINWEGADGLPSLPLELPGIPGPQWIHLCYTWNAQTGKLDGYINGTPLRLPGQGTTPWQPPTLIDSMQVHAIRWTLAGLLVLDHDVSREQALARVPSIYRGALDHTLGAQPLGSLDPEVLRGDTILQSPLDCAESIAGWQMEGPGAVAFANGWMQMRSLEPDGDGPSGHIVHWCNHDLPADFLLEFDVRILSPRGLNIIFFCATGRSGENALDPALSPRTGIFGHYTGGDLDCYHTSYYAHTPNNAGGRTTSNLRKNHGFYLVDNGPIGIPPASKAIHHVALLKHGGTIRLGIDGRCVIDWHDDGQNYGPVLGAGKFALRQMKWTLAEYRNLRVSSLKPDPLT